MSTESTQIVIDADLRQASEPAIGALVETLHRVVLDAVFVLFGSRARGTANRYSDYDIGVFRSPPLEFGLYSRLLDHVSAWNEKSLTGVQLVDLTRAEPSFLHAIGPDLVFLAGSRGAWCALLREAGVDPDAETKNCG